MRARLGASPRSSVGKLRQSSAGQADPVLALRSWLAGGLSELDHQLAIPHFVGESGDGACDVVSDSEACFTAGLYVSNIW